MYHKKIKSSKRGLTFLVEEQIMPIGQSFTYYIEGKNLYIKPTINGKNTVSKKKVGKKIKPLIDLRSKEVKRFLHGAESIEVVPAKGGLLVTVTKKIVSFLQTKVEQQRFVAYETLNQYELFGKAAGNEHHLYTQCDKIIREHLYDGNYTYEDSLSKSIKMISLFSGCGMMDYPFAKDENFNILFATDYDKSACESYRKNIGEHILKKDIRQLSVDEIPACDFILASPPCCAHSNSNRHNRLDNHECYDFIYDVIRIIKGKMPKIFALENVPSYLKAAGGSFLNLLQEKLKEYTLSIHYVTDYLVGGFTARKRLLLFGTQNGCEVEIPYRPYELRTIKDALERVDSSWPNYYDVTMPKEETVEKMKCVKPGQNFTAIPSMANNKKTHSHTYKRLSYEDRYSPTLANWRKYNLLHPKHHRILTVAEALSLSGFSNDFCVCGSLSEKQLQVGNGVPYAIARTIKDAVLSFFKRI